MFVAASLPAALLLGNNGHATWLFKTMPLSSPAHYFKGFIKSAFARFFMNFYLLVSVGICGLWGYKAIPDVVIALLSIYLITLLFYYIQELVFPFSNEKRASQGGAAFIKVMGMMIVAAILGFLHFFLLRWFNYASLLLVPFYLGVIYYVNRVFVYKKINWEEVDKANAYS